MPRSAIRGVSIDTRPPPLEKKSRSPSFELRSFLELAGVQTTPRQFRAKQTLFAQGDPASSILYIEEGSVKLTVVSKTGKEAILAILGVDDFIGKGCLAGQSIRMSTATAVVPTTVLTIEKSNMIRLLHEEHEVSDRFIAFMLARNLRAEEDLVDQLFNSSEKRLARALLQLARYDAQGRRGCPRFS
jgi:CRP/FNR family cyclic AMP-dependent transcriptional regulator